MKALLLLLFLSITTYVSCQDSTSQIYSVVQQMPVYPGGEDSMWRFINTHVKYPEVAVENNVEGKVIIGFIVNEDGHISDVMIKKGLIRKPDNQYIINNLPINTSAAEFGPTFFEDGQIIFSRIKLIEENNKKREVRDSVPFLNIYQKDSTNPLSGKELINDILADEGNIIEGQGSYNHKNRELYATGINNKIGRNSTFNIRLYSLIYDPKKNKWIEKPGNTIPLNDKNYSVTNPSLTPDGRVMYFASNMPGGFGGTDLYKTELDNTGKWTTPVNLGPVINTKDNELSPYISGDGTLYFSSNGHQGLGGLDIFAVKSADNNKWGTPENLGSPINSPGNDYEYIIDKDNAEGYFVSNRPGGKGDDDIYWFEKKDLASYLDSEAVRVVSLFPRFNPGMQDGKAVRVSYTLPISFKLQPNPADTIKKIFTMVEHTPEFPGGDSAMWHFIGDHINYPDFSMENDIMGKVLIGLVINEDGSMSDIRVLQKVHPDLDAEAIRVVKLMPKFKPGTQGGKPVRVSIKIPIKFRLTVSGEKPPYPLQEDLPNVYDKASVMPEYPEGKDKMMEFLRQVIKYPQDAKALNAQGEVIVSFVVNENGKLSDFAIAQEAYWSLNKEALRIAKLLPPFRPGLQDGKPVKVRYRLPVRFSLNDIDLDKTKDTSIQNLLEVHQIRIHYPEKALEDGIQGQVVVGFTINADGQISDYKIVKSVHPLLDAEALRVIKLLPNFKPHTGGPIKMEYPVDFKLGQ